MSQGSTSVAPTRSASAGQARRKPRRVGQPRRDEKAEFQFSVWTTDGVTDRGSHVNDAVRAEDVGVVDDVVVTNLRADKDMSPHVVSDAGAGVDQEVVVADETGTELQAVGVIHLTIEACGLEANATEEIKADFFG